MEFALRKSDQFEVRLPGQNVLCLAADTCTLYAGTTQGLFRFQNDRQLPLQLTRRETVTALAITPPSVWYTTWMGEGLRFYHPKQGVQTVGFPRHVRYNRNLIRMQALVATSHSIWIGTMAGLFVYEVAHKRWRGPLVKKSIEYLQGGPERSGWWRIAFIK